MKSRYFIKVYLLSLSEESACSLWMKRPPSVSHHTINIRVIRFKMLIKMIMFYDTTERKSACMYIWIFQWHSCHLCGPLLINLYKIYVNSTNSCTNLLQNYEPSSSFSPPPSKKENKSLCTDLEGGRQSSQYINTELSSLTRLK